MLERAEIYMYGYLVTMKGCTFICEKDDMRENHVRGSSLKGEKISEKRKGLWRNGIHEWLICLLLKFQAYVLVFLCSFSYSFGKIQAYSV